MVCAGENGVRVRKFDCNSTCEQVLEGMDLSGKTIAITGTTNGIGAVTARFLALADAHVVCLNRNEAASTRQIGDIRKEKPNAEVSFVKCDLASLASVRTAAEEILRRFQKLDVLILNAGIYQPLEPATLDGIEMAFGVNHVGHFLLTTLLLPLLENSSPSWIVVVSSHSHGDSSITPAMPIPEKIKLLSPEPEKSAPGLKLALELYSRSKLCNVLFAMKLHRSLHGRGVDVNVVHPGMYLATNISANMGFVGRVIGLLASPYRKTLDQGAATTVYCAINSELEGVSGRYWDSCWDDEKKLARELAHDEQLQDALWTETERIIGQIGK